ncbi:MAG: hypothetical protein H6Q90_7196 [Deltaproteobacteria bacterium]|nr:hypothetical protein [Deltaproteobacteria bacterium]
MFIRNLPLVACLLLASCTGQDPTSSTSQRIACATTPDCAARGGACVANECHADNECTTDTDCASGQTCVADPDFVGLCATPGAPPAPLPAWSCTYGSDCPALQGCASDGFCHVDGECHNTWQPDGTQAGDCAGADQICVASGQHLDGFCTDGRGGPDGYCRSTGTGECRGLCTTADDCGQGGTCDAAGFCHRPNECATTADCSPNHLCGNPDGWDDYGYLLCLDDPDPTCVPDGNGACRLACASDPDCLHGGGCNLTDHLCHGSNECHVCDPGLECYPDPEWGGLCGPPRPH